jgi:hypothetical protein
MGAPLSEEQMAVIVDAVGRGLIPGLGAGQNDTFWAGDNCDGTHALNIRYVIPSNCQRIVAARLSFHLTAFRDYDTGVSGVTTPAGIHYHTWVTSGSGTLNWTLGMDSGGSPKIGGAALPPPYGYQTGTDVATGSAQNSAFTTIDVAGGGHTHTFTPSLTRGVFEGTTATGVTVKFDGSDKTGALGGGSGFTTDQVELDVTQYIQRSPDRLYHTIALTPSGLGRIEAHLRLNYFANAGIPG